MMIVPAAQGGVSDLIHNAWVDPVGSKVIGGIIGSALTWCVASARRWLSHSRKTALLTQTNTRIQFISDKKYPLKYYAEFRNDSNNCVEVSFCGFQPDKIALRKDHPYTMQVEYGDVWVPERNGADRVAVLSKQLCRIWIGIDENRFTEQNVADLAGKLGVLTFRVDGRTMTVRF